MLPEVFDVTKLSYKQGESSHELVNRCWNKGTLKLILPVIRLLTVHIPGKRYDTWFYAAGPKTKMINLREYQLQNKSEALYSFDKITTDNESLGYMWRSAIDLLEAAMKS